MQSAQMTAVGYPATLKSTKKFGNEDLVYSDPPIDGRTRFPLKLSHAVVPDGLPMIRLTHPDPLPWWWVEKAS